jgi:hypothetical protein
MVVFARSASRLRIVVTDESTYPASLEVPRELTCADGDEEMERPVEDDVGCLRCEGDTEQWPGKATFARTREQVELLLSRHRSLMGTT